MKAIVLNAFGDVSNFSITEMPEPKIKDNEVLVQIKATGFNPIDYQMRLDKRESRLMKSPVLGREFSGIVIKTGSSVDFFKPGDEVMALAGSRGSNGTYAELIGLNQDLLALKPKAVSFEAAAAIPSSGITAWQCFARMSAYEKSRIFINGAAGGVGRFLIKLLKAYGSHKIVGTVGSSESEEALKSLGLQQGQIINYKEHNSADEIKQTLNTEGFDFAVDLVGGQMADTAAGILRPNGTYVDVTFLGTQQTREILFDKGASIINISGSAYAQSDRLNWYGQTLHLLSLLIEQGKIDAPAVNIIGGLSVETVQKGHEMMEANQVFGRKLIMTVS